MESNVLYGRTVVRGMYLVAPYSIGTKEHFAAWSLEPYSVLVPFHVQCVALFLFPVLLPSGVSLPEKSDSIDSDETRPNTWSEDKRKADKSCSRFEGVQML
jgi:hypothetical protein